eukprot:2996483-Rhodomonas_salina.1
MEHAVTSLGDFTQGYVLLNATEGTAYMLTVNAIFATEEEAAAARDELLFNLEGNHTFNDYNIVYPQVFGVTLSPGQYPVGPRVYRWVAESTAAELQVDPSGMEVEGVFFEPNCEQS